MVLLAHSEGMSERNTNLLQGTKIIETNDNGPFPNSLGGSTAYVACISVVAIVRSTNELKSETGILRKEKLGIPG